MRKFYSLFLVAFAGAAALLAYENQQDVTLQVFGHAYVTSVRVLAGATYLAGMLSGWTVVGILRRSLNRVTREPFPAEYATSR